MVFVFGLVMHGSVYFTCLLLLLANINRCLSLILQSASWSRPYSSRLPQLKAESNKGDTVPLFSAEWARLRGMEPGFGGLWPGDPQAPKKRVTIIDAQGKK